MQDFDLDKPEEIYEYFSTRKVLFTGPVCHIAWDNQPDEFKIMMDLIKRPGALDFFLNGLRTTESEMVRAYCLFGVRRVIGAAARPHARECAILWRLLFCPIDRLPRKLPSYRGKHGLRDMLDELPAVVLPLPKELASLLQSLGATDIRLLQAFVIAGSLRREQIGAGIFRTAMWAGSYDDLKPGNEDLLCFLRPDHTKCPYCGGNPASRGGKVFLSGTDRLKGEADAAGYYLESEHKQGDAPPRQDWHVELRCGRCGTRWRVTGSEAADNYAELESIRSEVNRLIQSSQKGVLDSRVFRRYLRSQDPLRREWIPSYVFPNDLGRILGSKHVRRAWATATESTELDFGRCASVLVGIKTNLDFSGVSDLRYALPSVVDWFVTEYLARYFQPADSQSQTLTSSGTR